MSNNFIKTSQEQSNQNHPFEKMISIFKKSPQIQFPEKKRTHLILQANKIFNEGNIEKARKIYATLNYYDGMVRVANYYYKSGKILEAFATYVQTGATKESAELSVQLAQRIKTIMNK